MVYYSAVWDEHSRNEVFRALASARRRLVTGLVRERRPDPVSLEAVVDALAGEHGGRESGDEARARDDGTSAIATRTNLRVELVHVHLPRLVESELVEFDATRGEVTAMAHPAYHDAGVRAILDAADGTEAFDADDVSRGHPDDSAESIDDLIAALANGRRRTVLSHLIRRCEPVDVESLARAVAAREADASDESLDEALDAVRTSLVHVHLPRLRDAGLIGYDDSGAVYCRGDRERYRRFVRSRPAHVLDGGFPFDSAQVRR